MKWEQLLEFKALFEDERRKLIYAQEMLNENFHVQTKDLPDSTDFALSELETSMRMRLRSREVLYLKKTEEALQRIALGTFGECEKCSKEIDIRQLQARPTLTFCASCKEEQENSCKLKSPRANLHLA